VLTDEGINFAFSICPKIVGHHWAVIECHHWVTWYHTFIIGWLMVRNSHYHHNKNQKY